MAKGGSTTQTTSIPEWQTNLMTGTVVPLAEKIAATPFTGYTGQFAPGMDVRTTQAGDIYGSLAGMTPEDYAARTAANMSPYQQNVIDASLAQMNREQAKALTGLEGQMIGSGAFGSRGEVARGEFEAANQAQRDALIAGMMQQGYQNAQGLTQQQIANMGTAASGLTQIGAAQTALDAANLQGQYGEFMREQGYPYQQLAGVLGVGQGDYGTTTTATKKPGLFDYLTLGATAASGF